MSRVLKRNITFTSKIKIPVPVDEGFFSINVQKNRTFLPRSTIRVTQERRYYFIVKNHFKAINNNLYHAVLVIHVKGVNSADA